MAYPVYTPGAFAALVTASGTRYWTKAVTPHSRHAMGLSQLAYLYGISKQQAATYAANDALSISPRDALNRVWVYI